MTPQDPLRREPREARKAKTDLLMQYVVDSLKSEEETRFGNQRTIYGQAAFVVGWLEAAPPNILDALAAKGTTTSCPLEGVHEHPFRGPHRFHEWEPGT